MFLFVFDDITMAMKMHLGLESLNYLGVGTFINVCKQAILDKVQNISLLMGSSSLAYFFFPSHENCSSPDL